MCFIDPLLSPFFRNAPVIVLDGAMATELEKKGAVINDNLWSARVLIEQPSLIREVHLDYLKSGAQIITTCSYQASFEGLEQKGFSETEAISLMERSTSLALEAVQTAEKNNWLGSLKPLVAASVGPYGAYLADGSEYRGHYGLSVEDLKNFHRKRMRILAGSGADLLAIETIPCIAEALALGDLLNEMPGVSAWLSFSCADDAHLSSGESWQEALALLNHFPGLISVGVNCTAPRYMEGLLTRANMITDKPLIAYPNRGEIWDATNKCWIAAAGHSGLASQARCWQQAGAKIIGGCCRTEPADIAALRELFRQVD